MPSNRNKRTRNTTEHVDVEAIEYAMKENNKTYNKLYPNQAPRALTGAKAKKAKKAEARKQISTKRSKKAKAALAAKKKEQVALAVKHCLENDMTAIATVGACTYSCTGSREQIGRQIRLLFWPREHILLDWCS